MSPNARPKSVDIYVRVSQTKGRDVEAEGGTAAEQERRCRAALDAYRIPVGEVFVDLDQSGGKTSRPAFDQAMARIEDGLSGGLAVINLSRFGRNRQVPILIEQLEQRYGATLISVEEKLDTSTPMGKFSIDILSAVNALYLDTVTEGWKRSHTSMIERGIQSGRPPVGYRKGSDRRLVPDEHAPAIRQAFRMRAEEQANWGAVARYLTEAGVPTHKGGVWERQAARKLVANEAYTGVVRHGDIRQEGAHEALVDDRTFRLANRKDTRFSGERGNGPLLGSGLLRCEACGHALSKGSTTARGKRYEFYRCAQPGKGHTTISATVAEAYLSTLALTLFERASDAVWQEHLAPRFQATAAAPPIDPDLQARYEATLADLDELAAALDAGEISAVVYARAAAKTEADRDELVSQLDAQAVRPQRVSRAVEDERDALALLVNYGTPEYDDLLAEDPEAIVKARRFIKAAIGGGTVTVRAGRGTPEERLVIEGLDELRAALRQPEYETGFESLRAS